jgi:hypothetical protein
MVDSHYKFCKKYQCPIHENESWWNNYATVAAAAVDYVAKEMPSLYDKRIVQRLCVFPRQLHTRNIKLDFR